METLWGLRGLAVIAIFFAAIYYYTRKSREPGGAGWRAYVVLFFAFIAIYMLISPPP